MRLTLACLLVVGAAAVAYAEAQNNPESSMEPSGESASDGRSFYTVTLTFSTSTSFTTTTKTTTCTTSTAGLSVCTASGRRRRGLHLSGNKEGRGLFYNDQEEHGEEGSIFLPSPTKAAEPEAVVDTESIRVERAPVAIPYVIQPGFSAPSDIQPRVLLAFSTITTTSTSTTTTTTSLTAICQSTTGFQVCGSNGK